MLICVFTGEDEVSSYVQQYLSNQLKCPILMETSPELTFPHKIELGVLPLTKIIEWKKYQAITSMLLIIFSKNADSVFYEDVCKLDKLTYKIKYLNGVSGMRSLEQQIDNINFDIRPSWARYFMDIAMFVSYRSSCLKRNVGAVLVKEKRIISTGYNGTAIGTKNCIDGGCPRCSGFEEPGRGLDLCFCLHAEDNAIMGVSTEALKGCELYVTCFPCLLCTKKIIQSRIRRITYKTCYCSSDLKTREIFEGLGIEVIHYKD